MAWLRRRNGRSHHCSRGVDFINLVWLREDDLRSGGEGTYADAADAKKSVAQSIELDGHDGVDAQYWSISDKQAHEWNCTLDWSERAEIIRQGTRLG